MLGQQPEKKSENFQNPLDKSNWMWYNKRRCAERRDDVNWSFGKAEPKRFGNGIGSLKRKSKKSFQNPLTNAERCDIINNVALSANRKRKAKARHSVSHKSEQKSKETEFTQLKKLKKFQRSLDKREQMWYNRVRWASSETERRKRLYLVN